MIPLCKCGCGLQVTVAKRTENKKGRIKGKFLRFLPHHHLKNKPKGANSPHWTGGITKHGKKMEYTTVYFPDHPHSVNNKIPLSKLIVEEIIGRILPKNSIVHHVDHNGGNDNKYNYVVCNDVAYHNLIHMRERAFMSCGRAFYRKCYICKQYDDPKNLYISEKGRTIYHRKCAHNVYLRRKAYGKYIRKAAEYGVYIPDPE